MAGPFCLSARATKRLPPPNEPQGTSGGGYYGSPASVTVEVPAPLNGYYYDPYFSPYYGYNP